MPVCETRVYPSRRKKGALMEQGRFLILANMLETTSKLTNLDSEESSLPGIVGPKSGVVNDASIVLLRSVVSSSGEMRGTATGSGRYRKVAAGFALAVSSILRAIKSWYDPIIRFATVPLST